MTKEARLTQKRLEGEILKMLDGKGALLLVGDVAKCSFCRKYADYERREEEFYPNTYYSHLKDCGKCPVLIGLGRRCYTHKKVMEIDGYVDEADWVNGGVDKAIPGALAIYMWLFEL